MSECQIEMLGRSLHVSLLAAYDLGAPAVLLQAIYDTERQILKPVDGETDVPSEHVKIVPDNFAKHLGQVRCVYLGERVVVQFIYPVDQVLSCLLDFLHKTDHSIWSVRDSGELCIQPCCQR